MADDAPRFSSENMPSEEPSESPNPGIPAIAVDRKRLDSNVRAFMRQPSTPWITFNRSSRIDSKVELRDLLPKTMFPSSEELRATEPAPSPIEEPSGMAVAADLNRPEVVVPQIAAADSLPEIEARRSSWRRFVGLAIGGAAGALVAALSINVLAVQPRIAELPKPLRFAAVEAPLPVTTIPSTKPAPPPDPAVAPNAKTNDGTMKLTHVTLSGKDHVWMNGKRLLGKGVRSYDVMCGMQQIAVGEKANAKFVDLPCGGEVSY